LEVVTNLCQTLKAQGVNKHYEMVFSEFAERLDMLEQQCHSQDKKALHNLQGWVKSILNLLMQQKNSVLIFQSPQALCRLPTTRSW
jgi:DNA-binding protein Fis